jgi:hypothetical protein
MGDEGLEKSTKSPEKARKTAAGGAQSGAVGAKLAGLTGSERAQIVERFAELSKPLQDALIEAAWPSLSAEMRARILRVGP